MTIVTSSRIISDITRDLGRIKGRLYTELQSPLINIEFHTRKDAGYFVDHLDPEPECEGGPEGREGAEGEGGVHSDGLHQMG